MSQTPQNKPNLMTRLETLEVQLARIQMIEQLAVNLRRSLTTVVEMMNAFVEEMGGKELGARIQNRLDEKRAEVRRAEAKRSGELMKRLIDEGQLEAVASIDEDSIIVALENSLDGKIQNEELQMAFMQFNPDIQEELRGKQVGYVLSREGKEALKIQSIWRMKTTPPKSLTETQAEDPTQVVGGGDTPPAAPVPPTQEPVEPKSIEELPTAEQLATAPAAE